MSTYIASLEDGGGEIIADLEVSLTLAEDRGLKSWYGTFWLPMETHLEPGTKLVMRLDDGRAGTVLIKEMNINSRVSKQLISFLGSGPLE